MNTTFRLDRRHAALFDGAGRRFDVPTRSWVAAPGVSGEIVDAVAACTWVQRQSGGGVRVPVGVIGPRDATPVQLRVAEEVGEGIAAIGLAVLCGGRQGVMEAVGRGVARAGGLAVGLLPDIDPALANPHMSVVIATGIGEARNALIARASLCLVAIGNSYGTLSEVALGRHFGKCVIGLEGAAQVEGVVHVADVRTALMLVAERALSHTGP